jgi:DNA-binding CsgD family transcriptional regulator
MAGMDDPRCPFVGRDHELDVLAQRLYAPATAWGGVVLLTGPAGVGKTRLLRALSDRLGDRIDFVDGTKLLNAAMRAPSPASALVRLKAHLQRRFAAGGAPIAIAFDGHDDRDRRMQDIFAGWDGFDAAPNARGAILFSIRTHEDFGRPGRSPLIGSLERRSLHVDLRPLAERDARVLVRIARLRGSLSRATAERAERLGEGVPGLLLALLGDESESAYIEDWSAFPFSTGSKEYRLARAAASEGATFDFERAASAAAIPIPEALEVAQRLVDAGTWSVERLSTAFAFRYPLQREALLEATQEECELADAAPESLDAIDEQIALARSHAEAGDPQTGLRVLNAIPSPAVRGTAVRRAAFYLARAVSRVSQGNLRQGANEILRAHRAIAKARIARSTASVASDLALFAVQLGQSSIARSEITRAPLLSAVSHGSDAPAKFALAAAELAFLDGKFVEARQRAFDAIACGSESLIIRGAYSVGIRIGVLLEDDVLLQACYDEEALQAAFESGRSQRIASVAGSVAQLIAARGEPRGAAALLHRATIQIERLHGSFWFPVVVAQLGSRRDFNRARSLLDCDERMDCGVARPMQLLFDAIVAKRQKSWRESAKAGSDAASAFASLRMPHFEALAWDAAGQTEKALELFERTGDVRNVRLVSIRRVARRRGETSLTARERDVSALAAQGLRTRAIADALSISEKTVQHHLQRAYGKLGVHSRWQLSSEELSR